MKSYRNGSIYVGQFSDGSVIPDGCVECTIPERGTDRWNGSEWVQTVFDPDWGSFLTSFADSTFGKRSASTPPPSGVIMWTITSIRIENPVLLQEYLSVAVSEYSMTADEKSEINNEIDLYHIPINHLT